MEKINDGGPAFPLDFMPVNLPGVPTGMSLRDYFAAKAMQAAIANTDFDHKDMNAIARLSYAQSDAMLKAREVK